MSPQFNFRRKQTIKTDNVLFLNEKLFPRQTASYQIERNGTVTYFKFESSSSDSGSY